MPKQKTIAKEIEMEGVGLHTGAQAKLCLKPAPENHGIVFVRTDVKGEPSFPAGPQSVVLDSGLPRCTTVGVDGVMIHTVEHLMSALWGLGITNILIEIDAEEMPGLDGSGAEFYQRIAQAGIKEQSREADVFRVRRPFGVCANGCSIYVVPADDFRISYTLSYDHPLLAAQFVELTLDDKNYLTEVAPARTFCLEAEAEQLQKAGLGKGANYQNTLVLGEKGVIDNTLRFPDEFARHKVLDIIGDLYLLGKPFLGHIFAVKSGHYLNLQVLRQIAEQSREYAVQRDVAAVAVKGKKEYGAEDIMRVLPHRYPFLFVDRVTILEDGKKAVGLKNLTGNEDFFQGHFPSRPVMPGVLMVEAMAQAAGVVVLTNPAHHDKLAFFMAIDRVKFRRVVVPGDQLRMEVEVIRDKSKITQVEAKGYVDDQLAVEANMTFSFTDAAYLDT